MALPNIKIVQKFSEEHKYDSEDRKGYKMVRHGGFGSSDVATGIDNMGMIAETETDPALHVAAKSNTGPALCRVKRKELYKARRRHLTVRKDTHGPGLSGAHPTSTDQRPGDEQVISKPLSERRQRGRADVLAEEIIATAFMEGRCIYDEEITEAISAWKFRKNPDRVNVSGGKQYVLSNNLGYYWALNQTQGISKSTTEYPNFTLMLNLWFQAAVKSALGRLPAGCEGGIPCTSICINSGFAATEHTDKTNVGLSWTRSLGFFKSGRLKVWPDRTSSGEAEYVDISNGITLFNGKNCHAVEDFEGERWSIIFFINGKSTTKATPEIKKEMRNYGFVPYTDEAGEAVNNLLEPGQNVKQWRMKADRYGYFNPDEEYESEQFHDDPRMFPPLRLLEGPPEDNWRRLQARSRKGPDEQNKSPPVGNERETKHPRAKHVPSCWERR